MTNGVKYLTVIFLLLFLAGRTAHCALSFNCYQLNNKYLTENCNKGTIQDKKELKTIEFKSYDFISPDLVNHPEYKSSSNKYSGCNYLPHKKFIHPIYISNLSLLI